MLRDLSLVRRSPGGRLAMPPPVRIYALELLRQKGTEQAARTRHAQAVLDLVEENRDRWVVDIVSAMPALAEEAENLREALRWTRHADPERHAHLAAGTACWFTMAGNAAELALELDSALATAVDPTLRARLMAWRFWTFDTERPQFDTTSRAAVDEARRHLGIPRPRHGALASFEPPSTAW